MKNKKINIALSVLIILILIVSGSLFLLNSKVRSWDNLIYPGVKLNNIDLSGKSLKDAKALINNQLIEKLKDKKILVTAAGKEYMLNYSDLNMEFKEDDVLLETLSYGKDGSVIKRYNLINNKSNENFQLKFSYDENKIKELGDKINKEISKEPKNADITYLGGDKFSVTEDQVGHSVDENALINDIKNAINVNTQEMEIIIKANVKETAPKSTKEDLAKIDTLISTFSTNFSSSSSARATNIKVASNKINGTVLMPGESFSFNGTIGETTPDKGYKEAGIILNGEADQGYGGGVCQVSTTLYNTVLRANLKIKERHNHTLPSHYIGLGMDATVANPYKDFKFTNSYDTPIYIRAYIVNRNIDFAIYSASAEKKYNYTITSKSTSIPTSYTVKYDNTLEEGKVEISKEASLGHNVSVYRNTLENGKIIKTELIYKDTYKPVKGVKVVGTKKVTPPEVKEVVPAVEVIE